MAVITGSGAGIAEASAEIFAREGARAVVAEIKEQKGTDVAARINEHAFFVSTDVTNESSVEQLMQQSMASFGRIDVLFSCAGGSVANDSVVAEVDMDVWQKTIPIDLMRPFLCARNGIPHIIACGGSSVINVSSVGALRGNHPAHVYSAAKGERVSFTRSLAGAYSSDGVRSNVICPGMIATDRIKSRHSNKPKSNRRAVTFAIYGSYKFGAGEPVDIANIALLLASDVSRMINGATIPAEGGFPHIDRS